MEVTPNVRLLKPLGEGGMGCVWVGEHLTLKTHVAVKFISSEAATSPEAHLRFAREASAAAQIKSPHVVQTFDHGLTPDDVPYIVMELLEGEDLAEHLFRVGTIGLERTAHIVDHVAKALGRAHKLGIVHRDIKPDNIFLTEVDGDLFCKVLDFGVAKRTSSLGTSLVTSVGTMVGTPAYMSPEQILSDKPVDFHSDLWSVGVCAYHALTGDTPFNGETLGAICVAIADGKFTPPSQIRPELPPAVDAWMARALAVDPQERFSSAREMAKTLSSIARGEPFGEATSGDEDDAEPVAGTLVSQRPEAVVRRETAPARTIVLTPGEHERVAGKRSRLVVWLAVAGLAAAAAAAAVFLATRGPTARPTPPASAVSTPDTATAPTSSSTTPTATATSATTTSDAETTAATASLDTTGDATGTQSDGPGATASASDGPGSTATSPSTMGWAPPTGTLPTATTPPGTTSGPPAFLHPPPQPTPKTTTTTASTSASPATTTTETKDRGF